MEMTIEQKQRKYEKEKEWRIAHPEKMREYARRSYEKNRDYYREYYKNYYKIHREEILATAKKWREENKIDSVYFFIDSNVQTLYIGSTGGRLKERMSAHLTSNSNLGLTIEELVFDWKLSRILYKDFTQYNLSRNDLYWIENYYKESCEDEILAKMKAPKVDENELSRSVEELIEIAENTEYMEYKLDKYLN